MNRKTVSEFAASSPFTEPQIRWWLHNRQTNGMEAAGACVRIGRRIYIDVDGFERWVASQNPRVAA